MFDPTARRTQGRTVFEIPSTPGRHLVPRPSVSPWPSPRRRLHCVPCLAGAPPARGGPESRAPSSPSSTTPRGRRPLAKGTPWRRTGSRASAAAAGASRWEVKPPWCRGTQWRTRTSVHGLAGRRGGAPRRAADDGSSGRGHARRRRPARARPRSQCATETRRRTRTIDPSGRSTTCCLAAGGRLAAALRRRAGNRMEECLIKDRRSSLLMKFVRSTCVSSDDHQEDSLK